ncbi:hypothetical protein [Elizabethkingia meningoseptica]|uniref:hypothetical protein n=1 Tax=Elizabethkingia meningoseptica TaxID=238 RepID=UPI001623C207|nr:hypothetical protein [Elizabethkingia meningoseptica]MDE5432988.1 hypothetical protein [Elizabethkingia meningoseptica]HAY3553795.1 hypothetical protein [Elizabethkingia meningoseptica]
METPKQQAIKAAYGELYIKHRPDENGWVQWNIKNDFGEENVESKVKGDKLIYRLKILRGIETNNGWNKVEFDSNGNLLDKDSLPKKPGEYNIINRWGILSKYILKSDQNEKNVRDWQWSKYTHWRPSEATKPPIF